jgi:threonyl-tRNA synthetase
MLVVGGQEETAKTVTLRTLDGAQTPGLTIEKLLEKACSEMNPAETECTNCEC